MKVIQAGNDKLDAADAARRGRFNQPEKIQVNQMLAPIAQQLVCLGEVGTMHVCFTSEGRPRGTHVTADPGEFLCLPGDACGCDGSPWSYLLSTIDGTVGSGAEKASKRFSRLMGQPDVQGGTLLEVIQKLLELPPS